MELHQDVLSSVLWTFGDAGTHRHPQFFTVSHGSGCRSDRWCRVWDPGQACLDDDACISYDFVVGSQADSCRFYSEATLPENRAAQTCDGHCGPIVKEECDLTFAWGEYSGFYTLSSKGNPLIELTILLILRRNMEVASLSSSEDLRTPVRRQAVKQSAELRSSLVSSQQRNHSVCAHLRASTVRVSRIP